MPGSLGVTAPAIYNYFPRLDDLITALVIDAFSHFADAIVAAIEASANEASASQLRAGALAYRQWAIDHAVDFELIYGNPIPGYEAPAEITVPLAARPLLVMGGLLLAAHRSGELRIPDAYTTLPPAVEAYLAEHYAEMMEGAPITLVTLLASSWSHMHGMVMLELFGHLGPVVGDSGAFYAQEIDVLLASFGL
ncbi:MAG: TetR/AcrR family transcriptional regulator [Caldilineaceae bacterium]|nr:TetR/AcrR family transcriptional regulator [Caldilineaceae bacterium]